jgi:hypothetical protein
MHSRGNFWPDLHNLYLSFVSEGDTNSARLQHIRNELERFPPAIRDELASDLSALSSALSDLVDTAPESDDDDVNALAVSGSHSA